MEAINGIKIYQCGEDDWFAAATPEGALAAMVEHYGVPGSTPEEMREEYMDGGEPMELTEAQMDKLLYVETDEDDEPTEVTRTFREELELRVRDDKASFPQLFASSNF